MRYYSTSHQAPVVGLAQAILHSDAPDGGLYLPERIPLIPTAFFKNFTEMSLPEIAYVVANLFFGQDISSQRLKDIVDETYSFDVPLVEVEPNVFALELFHGPTGTFKDIGARFIGRILGELHNGKSPLNVIVPTSGNTGQAVARGLAGVKGINVIVIFPKSLTRSQIAHFTAVDADNVHTVQVDGDIDDCRSLTAQLLNDPHMTDHLQMTMVNSTNIGRMLAPVACYIYGRAQICKRIGKDRASIWFSVPSGNLGNLMAGYMAVKMGLKCNLIAACNTNGAFHRYLQDGKIDPAVQSIHTSSYAMDTAHPRNIPRFMDLCKGDISRLRKDIVSGISTEEEIDAVISDLKNRCGYSIEQHSAVAYKCLKEKLPHGSIGVFLATSAPDASKPRTSAARQPDKIAATYPALKKYINRITL